MRLFVYLLALKQLCLLLCILCIASVHCYGQDTVYANTDNLLLRDRPEKKYNVFAVLYKGCPLRVEPYEKGGYKNYKPFAGRFWYVIISYDGDAGIHHKIYGWVMKKYTSSHTTMPRRPVTAYFDFIGADSDNPDVVNGGRFPSPKYKGGEMQPGKAAKVYHKGPRGGCYYLNSKGHKVYVDKKFCDELKKKQHRKP
jgi:hypothetical protein